jgi:carbonic anhydrase/acetyltransferase-like protein (isoleucine patch superfamily)
MIGNTASLMPMSKVGAFCAVAAGSVLTEMKEIPDYSFAVGSPAKVHSKIDPDNPAHVMRLSRTYLNGPKGMAALAQSYIDQGIWDYVPQAFEPA